MIQKKFIREELWADEVASEWQKMMDTGMQYLLTHISSQGMIYGTYKYSLENSRNVQKGEVDKRLSFLKISELGIKGKCDLRD